MARNTELSKVHLIQNVASKLSTIDDSSLDSDLRHKAVADFADTLMQSIHDAAAAHANAKSTVISKHATIEQGNQLVARVVAGVLSHFGADSQEYQQVSAAASPPRRSGSKKAKGKSKAASDSSKSSSQSEGASSSADTHPSAPAAPPPPPAPPPPAPASTTVTTVTTATTPAAPIVSNGHNS